MKWRSANGKNIDKIKLQEKRVIKFAYFPMEYCGYVIWLERYYEIYEWLPTRGIWNLNKIVLQDR